MLFFLLFFGLKAAIRPKFYIRCRLDDLIPFVKWFLFPYCFWYVYLFAALCYFAVQSKPDFVKLQSNIFIGMGICLLVYAVFPNAIGFRPVITQKDPVSSALAFLFSIDSSTMVTPSMHVFDAIAVHLSLVKSRLTGSNRPLKALSLLAVLLICASTVFIKQHSVIDVFWGVVLAAVLYFPIYGKMGKKLAQKRLRFGRQ